MLVDKQNQKLKLKFTNYEKANKVYVINNAQLKAENNDLENWLADLEKQLKNTQLDKHSALSPPPLPWVVSDDLDNNLKLSQTQTELKSAILSIGSWSADPASLIKLVLAC